MLWLTRIMECSPSIDWHHSNRCQSIAHFRSKFTYKFTLPLIQNTTIVRSLVGAWLRHSEERFLNWEYTSKALVNMDKATIGAKTWALFLSLCLILGNISPLLHVQDDDQTRSFFRCNFKARFPSTWALHYDLTLRHLVFLEHHTINQATLFCLY